MKPWEESWDNVVTDNVETGSMNVKKPWEENWNNEAEINVADYNGTYLIGNKGEDVKPFEKMKMFMDRLFTFKVKTGAEVEEKYKNNKNIQAAEKIKNEGFDDVEWGEVGKAAVRGTFELGKNLTAEPLKMYGDWVRDKRDVSMLSKEEADKVKMNNFTADSFSKVGGYIEKLWDWGLKAEWLKEDEKIFAGDFVNNPSITRVLSLGTSAIPSLAFGGGIAKITKSPTLAAVMLSGADSTDIYWGAREAGKSQNEALGLFAAGTVGTAVFEKYGLDTIYDKKIMPFSKRVVMSVLSEGLTEGTQTAYQNMVKKYGYDDTQLLMEGVVESMIGGAIGGGAMSAAYGGYAKLRQARENLSKKGLEDPDLDVIQEGFAREISQHRDTIEPLFQENINKSLNTLEKFIAENEGTAEASKALQTKQELEQVYTDVFEGLKKTGMNENIANADAKIWQGMALFGAQETGLSPLEYIRQRMPKVEGMTFEQFQNRETTLEEELDDYIPYQAMYKSPLRDIASFYNDVVANPNKKKRYFSHVMPDGTNIDIMSDVIAHDQKHNMTDDSWQEVLDNIDNIENFVVSDKPRFDGQPVLMKITTPKGKYGVVIEHLKNGRNIITTAFKGTDKGIDSWMKKETGKDQSLNVNAADALPSQPVALEGKNSSTVAFASQQSEISDNPISNNANRSFKDIISVLDENVNNALFQLPAEAYNKQGKADVNSEAFKRWFGDSKVVDENGQPLVVYHGANAKFDVFKGKYHFFSDRENVAAGYGSQNPLPVYLSMKNPLIVDAYGQSFGEIYNAEEYKKAYKDLTENDYKKIAKAYDLSVNEAKEFFPKNEDGVVNLARAYGEKPRSTNEWAEYAKKNGYDGVIIKDVNDTADISNVRSTDYVVFEPNQIKSVNNRGTFDQSNDNIYYQHGENKNIVKITGKEFGGYTDSNDLRRKAYKYFQDNLQGQYVQHPTLGKIKFIRRGIDKLKSTSADIDKLKLVPKIKEIIETSQFLRSETPKKPHGDIVKFHYLSNSVNLEGKNIDVFISIAEDNEGNFFYNINKNKNQPSPDNAVQMRSGEGLADKSAININIAPTRENVNSSYQEASSRPKGAYLQNLDRNGVIYLFEKADASTFMHETAHFFRKELKGFNTARSREMLKNMDEWENQEFDKRYKLKEENGAFVVTDKIGNVVYGVEKPFFDAGTARDYARNEIFARGFEQYLREGKAPNNYLKQAFRSFWNWLRHIYKAATDLNVDVNDDIRAVYGDIIGGKDLDFYLSAPVDEVLQQHFDEKKDRKRYLDEQIRLAQAQPVKKGFAANLAQERTDGAKGRNEWWNKALIPISTRAKRVNIKLRNKLRAYDYGINTKLNQYYAQIKPFLDKWATMTETDAVAFDLALKNGYIEKQLEIVNKYGAYDEFVAVKNLLNSLFDQAVDVGIKLGYTADYFPRQIEDVEGFMRYIYGSPMASQLRRTLREADPDNVMTIEQKAEFFNKYLRGFNRRDLNKPLPGNTKDRSIDIVTAEMNQFYAPSMQALINYVDGMNTSIESRRLWGFKYDDINQSIGALTADLVDTGLIKPEQDAEVQAILRARFKAKGVTNKWLNLQKNVSYIYTMGGINSAITQIDDISMSLYKAGLWNTVQSVFSKNRPGLSREELGLERIGQEFAEASASSQAVNAVFKLTGLDKIDAFGKNTLINATFNKFQKMAQRNPEELRKRIEPVMEQETEQTIEDIKNGVVSENVKLLMFNELADVQPISLSEMPEWYLTSGNGRVFYMLKTFTIKRLDIFRNECFDKIRDGKTKEGIQNLFRLAIFMILCGASKDAIIDMLFGRDFDMTDTMVNNVLGLAGISKYSLYKARDEGFTGFASSFIIPPVFAPTSDLLSDIYKSLFSKKGKDISDYEIWKGVPLIGRFYYWWLGGGKAKQERKKKKKLK